MKLRKWGKGKKIKMLKRHHHLAEAAHGYTVRGTRKQATHALRKGLIRES